MPRDYFQRAQRVPPPPTSLDASEKERRDLYALLLSADTILANCHCPRCHHSRAARTLIDSALSLIAKRA